MISRLAWETGFFPVPTGKNTRVKILLYPLVSRVAGQVSLYPAPQNQSH
jgi:hypothetical protein